ncbi:polysaccharide biosynthesis protein [Clostridium estertheticum]|uniref:polysaccharide biosynthesis protein n=1 Tax=Clostridium estertheticum TaxID=238834 RepID=UPI00124F0B5C|nr:nucleoside-diphosphate sugar epimerase/dehydratase [Clostridium estertheticum]MBU3073194.1 polysaccharide biosynthesis protein [Clostridium estertheticum]MBU3163565.1 polysaccharide biosynthesis protein [Clostridium estertheticum]MBZ9616143.1 polysaccharide biosynthesis protein [Clostridium estertheticum subsp. laramiense]WAG71892.1 polysaccharide biosynthesis protein [Clostridium estertheticum]
MKVLGKWKKPILMLSDAVLINLAYILAFFFIYNYKNFRFYSSSYKEIALIVTVIYITCFYIFKLYESLWKYASIDEFMLVIGACLTSNIVMIAFVRIIGHPFAYGVSIIACAFSIIFIVGLRMSFRVYGRFESMVNCNASKIVQSRVMIIGAGSAAAMVIKEMKSSSQSKYMPIAVIDDEVYKKGNNIAGVKVLGNRKDIPKIVIEKNIETILIAIPTIEDEDKEEILEICKKTNCKIEIIPGMYEIINGKVSLNQIRKVEIEDLLGRKAVKLDMQGITSYITNKTVLVTGGGGSIGSELCRQIIKFNPKQLIVFDIYENNAYDLQMELEYKYPKLDLLVLIGSVRDKKRLEDVFEKYSPNIVFHAAAHKHVPLMENSPMEAIKNNVFGTYNVAECAHKFNVERFVMISTDKAVNPTNVMGATKRMCEMIIQSMDKISKTHFVAVRFGNVLGSNGSVIPLFKKQIEHGGPVTLTNKYITRFFMTIPEAAQLVLQSGAYAQGGEIFVLDMGKPVKIYDLAWDLIKLSGFVPDEDIKIEITGLRPGEKLYEELLMSEEGLTNTKHEKIFIGKPTFTDLSVMKEKMLELAVIIEKDDVQLLIDKIGEIVPTYNRTLAESATM